jgi:hypothetical protein
MARKQEVERGAKSPATDLAMCTVWATFYEERNTGALRHWCQVEAKEVQKADVPSTKDSPVLPPQKLQEGGFGAGREKLPPGLFH